MLRTLGRGILLAVANEANTRRLDERNQLIDFRLRLRIQRQCDRNGEEQRENGSEKLTHEIGFDGLPRAATRLAASLSPVPGCASRDRSRARSCSTPACHPHASPTRDGFLRVRRDTPCG